MSKLWLSVVLNHSSHHADSRHVLHCCMQCELQECKPIMLQRTCPAMRHTENRKTSFLCTLQAMRKTSVCFKNRQRGTEGVQGLERNERMQFCPFTDTHTHTVSWQPGAMENATLCAARKTLFCLDFCSGNTGDDNTSPVGIFLFSHSVIQRR